MGSAQRTDILIVGAGPVGMTLAIDLARRGVACRIVESLPSFAVGTRARGISPRTQEIFEDLGVLQPLREYDEPRLPTRFYDRAGAVVRVAEAGGSDAAPLAAPGVPHPAPLVVNQHFTDRVLRERLESLDVHVELDCRLEDYESNADHVVARLSRAGRRETIDATYLVGCDGGRSTVRRCAGIPLLGSTPPDDTTYLLANVGIRGLDPGFWHVWTDPTWGYLTVQPVVHGDTWLFAATVSGTTRVDEAAVTTETLRRLFAERAGMAGVSFHDLIWRSTYRRNLRVADRYRVGRVLLAGDSAHVGVEHGMNIGIQEAYNLGWKLAHVLRGSPDALLDSYESERLPIVQRIQAAIDARARTGSDGTSAAARTLTDAVLNRDPAADPTQLSISYRADAASCDGDATATLRAGDRAPDAECAAAGSGDAIRLFDLFHGTHFTLLLFDGGAEAPRPHLAHTDLRVFRVIRPGAAPSAEYSTVVDVDGNAHAAYGVDSSAMVLVRPDGHVAASGDEADAGEVVRYLRSVLGERSMRVG
jgi:2-polyprenyl-6-methoxyphenol hydroxylase-like FAD-dependent oxidoreductase